MGDGSDTERKHDKRARPERSFGNATKKLRSVFGENRRAIDMRAGGEITEEEFARKKAGLSEEKKRLQNVMENIDADAGDWLRVAEESFDFASRAGRAFAETKNPARKKEIARTLCSNLSLKDGKVVYILEKPFPAIQKMKKILDTENARVRTAKNGSAQKENEPLWARCPEMLRLLNTIRTSIQEDKASKFYYFGLKKFMEQGV